MSKWISIEERLPKDDKLKVCRYKSTDSGKHIGIVLSRYYSPSNMPDHKRRWCFEFGNCQPVAISHWADLPEETQNENP